MNHGQLNERIPKDFFEIIHPYKLCIPHSVPVKQRHDQCTECRNRHDTCMDHECRKNKEIGYDILLFDLHIRIMPPSI